MNVKKKRLFLSRPAVLWLAALILVLGSLTGWLLWGNLTVGVTRYEVASERLPPAFEGFCVAQVSDLHSAEFGEGNHRLLSLLTACAPDIIALTGDLADDKDRDFRAVLTFAEAAAAIAPVYYVTGNHEGRLPAEDYARLEEGLEAVGVTVLHNEAVTLEREGARITVLGLDDPRFTGEPLTFPVAWGDSAPAEQFTLALSHKPHLLEAYAEAELDVVLCGHVHGGQVRLPLLGGLYAPDQGLLPTYDSGLFTEGLTTMVVSRGLGNGTPIPRVGNRPELVVVELTRPT